MSSAGGAAAENVVFNLKLARHCFIVGTDVDADMLKLSSADVGRVVHHAGECLDWYLRDIRGLAEEFGCGLFIPVSDREIYVSCVNKAKLPPTVLPDFKVVEVCRDKAKLYGFMEEGGLPVPRFAVLGNYHCQNKHLLNGVGWVRATVGAGGYLSRKTSDKRELESWLFLNRNAKRQFMLSEYLGGKNFCWTSLWRDGQLVFSVCKERLKWVYDRIGTTAVQKIVHNAKVNKVCEETIKLLRDKFDVGLSGLMMADLKADNGEVFVTEINAGRAGTVSLWYTLASKVEWSDDRANFHHQLLRVANGEKLLPVKRRDALPIGFKYVRHIDMGSKLLFDEKPIAVCRLMPLFGEGVAPIRGLKDEIVG